MNAVRYQMLHNELLPFCEIEDKKTIFQHYNTPIHTIATTEKWFLDFEIELLPWPVLNIDLNPIENLWGIPDSRKVYDQEKPPI